MFEVLLVYFQNSWGQFTALKSIEQLSVVFTICAPLGGVLYTYSEIVTRRLRLKSEELHKLQELSENRFQQVQNLLQQLKKRDDTINVLESQLPDYWLRQAAKERKVGNDERAIKCLRSGFESIREPLTACCLDLASYHFSLVVDYGERHLDQAECLGRIATLLSTSDKEPQLFLAEVLAVKAEGECSSGNYQTYNALWDEVDDFMEIGNDLEKINTLENHAIRYYKNGHYRLAERLFSRVLQIGKRNFGPDSEVTLRVRSWHASSVGNAGRCQEALSLFHDLLPDSECMLGKDHHNTLATRSGIALWTWEAGDAAGALTLFDDLLPDQERILGKNHADTLVTRGNIALLAGVIGDVAGALKLSHALLLDQERVRGKDHPDTLKCRGNVTSWIGQTGDAAGALMLCHALLSDRERVVGKDHPDTLMTRSNIAHWTGQTGDTAGALALCNTLLPDQERILGKEHPNTLKTRSNIASLTGITGDAARALALCHSLLPDQERMLGKDHPDTLATRHNITFWTAKVG